MGSVLALGLTLGGCAPELGPRDASGSPRDAGPGSDGSADAAPGDDAPGPVSCVTNDDCLSDTRCLEAVCVSWDAPPAATHDDSCVHAVDIDAIEPEIQCQWEAPPAGDGFPEHVHVMSTAVVVDFDFDRNPLTLAPSIVFPTYPSGVDSAMRNSYNRPGVLRVIDGATCEQQWTGNNTDLAVAGAASVAVGDLDGDGRSEIVAVRFVGGLIAFAWNAARRAFETRWTSATCSGGARTADRVGGNGPWSGPSIHDLDDDGIPEIIYGATVYGSDGCVIVNPTFPLNTGGASFPAGNRGVIPVIADVDEDGRMELVRGNSLVEWSGGGWVPETTFRSAGLSVGNVAIGELGDFPGADGMDHAEIVVIGDGEARVQTIEGRVVFGPITIPGGGLGGPPTIADFDGDGRAEFATAGSTQYVVFDLDCMDTADPSGCGTARTDGILWSQPSQDVSSNVTGSSVFDFDADGAAEAVYADECFVRIYDGATGDVVFSAARSSGTAYENPTIVDVDGDFHTEIVVSANSHSAATVAACPSEDPLRAGAAFSPSHGIIVLRDVMDRWAGSRPIWSQHAYAVTHVGDHGEIPRTSAVLPNWRQPGLNNFRQNVLIESPPLGVPDLTTAPVGARLRVPCDAMGRATLSARVCNRGSLPMAAGFVVEFRSESRDGPALCRASSATFLDVGVCEETSCDATLPLDRAIDVFVVADPDRAETECFEGNNFGFSPNVACETVD